MSVAWTGLRQEIDKESRWNVGIVGASDKSSSCVCNWHRLDAADLDSFSPIFSDLSKLCLLYAWCTVTVTDHNSRSIATHELKQGLL